MTIDTLARRRLARAGGGAGYNSDPTAGRRERLWMSPACRSSEQGVLL